MRGTAAAGKGDHAQHPDAVQQRKRDRASDAYLFGRFLDALAVDPDVAGLDHRLGEGPALHKPDEKEKPVDPHVSSARVELVETER